MKKIRKTTMLIFALVLSLSVTVGATLAYFSDYEEASGGATLHLGGQTELKEGNVENQKDIQIRNTGKTYMLVRVGIYGPDNMTMPDPGEDNEWWFKGDDGFYYLKEALAPGKETPAGQLVAKLQESWTGDQPEFDYEVTVVHEGCQVLYNNKGELVYPDGWSRSEVDKIKIPEITGKEGE